MLPSRLTVEPVKLSICGAVVNLKEATELYPGEAPHLWHEACAPVTRCTDFLLEVGRGPFITTFEVSEDA